MVHLRPAQPSRNIHVIEIERFDFEELVCIACGVVDDCPVSCADVEDGVVG